MIIIGLIRGIVKPGVDHSPGDGLAGGGPAECSQAARAHGVRLALEPINRYETTLINTTAQGLELIERVGADNFGLLLDTFHMNIEEPDIEASIRPAGRTSSTSTWPTPTAGIPAPDIWISNRF